MEKRCNGSVRSARKVVQKDTLGVSLEFRKIKKETNLDDIAWKITFYFIEQHSAIQILITISILLEFLRFIIIVTETLKSSELFLQMIMKFIS